MKWITTGTKEHPVLMLVTDKHTVTIRGNAFVVCNAQNGVLARGNGKDAESTRLGAEETLTRLTTPMEKKELKVRPKRDDKGQGR